jgi:inositol-pentakisphosphate 2-kinase
MQGTSVDVREVFTDTILPLLTRTPVLQTLNRLQRTLDMLDIEGLSQLWNSWHRSTNPSAPVPHIGQDTLEPTVDEWNEFIDDYLAQAQKSSQQIEVLPAIDTGYQLRKYLLAYLLSATFKDCSIIVRMDLLDTSQSSEVRVDPKRVTVIDLDPKSMTRLRKWEQLDAEIVSTYQAAMGDSKTEKTCIDGWSG